MPAEAERNLIYIDILRRYITLIYDIDILQHAAVLSLELYQVVYVT